MGLLDAVGYGLSQGTAGMADDITAQIRSDIERSRQEALMVAKQEMDDRHSQAVAGRVKERAGGLIHQAEVSKVNEMYGPDSKLERGDIADEEFAANKLSDREKRLLTLQAAQETGALPVGAYEKVMLDEDRADRSERVAGIKAAQEERKMANQERRTDLMDRKLMAAIAGRGAKEGDLPSDAKMADWLVANGVSPDKKSAYERVTKGKSKDDIAVQASIFAKLAEGDMAADKAALWKQAGKMVKNAREGEDSPSPVRAGKSGEDDPLLGWGIKRVK